MVPLLSMEKVIVNNKEYMLETKDAAIANILLLILKRLEAIERVFK